MKLPTLTTRSDGILVTEQDVPQFVQVDSFIAGEAAGETQSDIMFRLYQKSTDPIVEGQPIPLEAAHQFLMRPDRARKFAASLLIMADEIEGVAQPRQ
jgi:hypothetical protein